MWTVCFLVADFEFFLIIVRVTIIGVADYLEVLVSWDHIDLRDADAVVFPEDVQVLPC